MSLILIGTNHKHSSLEVRENLAFSGQEAGPALKALLREGHARGAVVLSTCHRVEAYAEAEDVSPLWTFFRDRGGSWLEEQAFYIKTDADAVAHLFGVAAGLDSEVIGENEILRQVKEAYFLAKENGALTPYLNKAFERALFTGKLVRRKTGISRKDPSLAVRAVERAQESAGSLSRKKIFIIGAGRVAETLGRLCAERRACAIFVANRTFQRAQELAGRIGGEAVRFDDFYLNLDRADILFSATASRHFVLKKDVFAAFRDAAKKMALFDLAVPRDIDPAIGELENVTLFDLDDLKAEGAWEDAEVAKARRLVQEKAQRFSEKAGSPWKTEPSGSVYGPALLP